MVKVSKRIEIKNRLGLHARAAALLVQTVKRYSAAVNISKDGQVVDGRSLIGLLTLGAAKGSRLQVVTRGTEAEEAAQAIEDLIEKKFHEAE